MKKTLFAGLLGAFVLLGAQAIPAKAGCGESGICGSQTHAFKKKIHKKVSASHRKTTHHAHSGHRRKAQSHRRGRALAPAQGGRVVALIKAMAPQQGVPAWFALRIAKVESNYNPHLRGRAGEYGVFQLKCATARGIGYRGNCSGLLDARTNIRFGIRHLALAMKSSRGNLKLAASKHNGGLGRKTIVYGYVAKVF